MRSGCSAAQQQWRMRSSLPIDIVNELSRRPRAGGPCVPPAQRRTMAACPAGHASAADVRSVESCGRCSMIAENGFAPRHLMGETSTKALLVEWTPSPSGGLSGVWPAVICATSYFLIRGLRVPGRATDSGMLCRRSWCAEDRRSAVKLQTPSQPLNFRWGSHVPNLEMLIDMSSVGD